MDDKRTKLGSAVKDYYLRAQRRLERKWSDVELRQLRQLQRAYAHPSGPEVLVFGDSAMFWTEYTDRDRSNLVDMLRAELGMDLRTLALIGPGYNARIVTAFLTALEGSRSRPRVVVVPTSVIMATTLWLAHPRGGYGMEAEGIRAVVRSGDSRLRRLDRPSDEAFEDYDRLPAPSLYGARRTVGELRLITSSRPETRWQTAVRTRHLMDFHNAERLEPTSIGVTLVAELGEELAKLQIPSVAYIAPVNHEVLKISLGAGAVEHMQRNAELIATTFLEAAGPFGQVVNATMACSASDFGDPLHLREGGRRKLARSIAEAARTVLDQDHRGGLMSERDHS